MYKIMTPGPTQVAENVRLARSRECTNPDLDENFVEFYKETCEEISRLLHTDNETLILSGEGILGLEAACASMTEPGDRSSFWTTASTAKDSQILFPCTADVRSSTPEITVKHLMYRNSKTSSKNIMITNTQPLSTEIHQAVC